MLLLIMLEHHSNIALWLLLAGLRYVDIELGFGSTITATPAGRARRSWR